jgi:hypothetical protein
MTRFDVRKLAFALALWLGFSNGASAQSNAPTPPPDAIGKPPPNPPKECKNIECLPEEAGRPGGTNPRGVAPPTGSVTLDIQQSLSRALRSPP